MGTFWIILGNRPGKTAGSQDPDPGTLEWFLEQFFLENDNFYSKMTIFIQKSQFSLKNDNFYSKMTIFTKKCNNSVINWFI